MIEIAVLHAQELVLVRALKKTATKLPGDWPLLFGTEQAQIETCLESISMLRQVTYPTS